MAKKMIALDLDGTLLNLLNYNPYWLRLLQKLVL